VVCVYARARLVATRLGSAEVARGRGKPTSAMTPPRRDAHGGWLVALCLTLGGNAAAVAAGVRPHIVFLMADDLCALPTTHH
jgi:hypothetical protein